MVSTHDLTQQTYSGYPAKSQSKDEEIIWRRFTGAQLKAVVNGTGATPGNGDSYKIFKLSAKQIVAATYVVVVNASSQSITTSLGYTNGTNTSASAFLSAGANFNAAATTYTAASATIKMIDNDGYWFTFTPSTLASLEDAFEIVIAAKIIDLSLAGITTALTNVV